MEDFQLVFDFGSFLWVLLSAFIYAIAGGIFVGILDLIARFRKVPLDQRWYWLALALSFFFGVFIEYRSTLETIRSLKTSNQSLTTEVSDAKREVSLMTGRLVEAYKQRDEIALAKAALQVTKDGLEKDIKAYQNLDHPKPYIDIQAPRLRNDNTLVLLWRNTGYVEAVIYSAESFVFVNDKLYKRQQFIKGSMLAIPSQQQSFESEVPENIFNELREGRATMRVALEMKYAGSAKEKSTICYEAKYDKPLNTFVKTRFIETVCDKSMKK